MKRAYVITEGQYDAEFLKKVLPAELLEKIDFVARHGLYTLQSLARSILAVKQQPVALVVDADTNEQTSAQERE